MALDRVPPATSAWLRVPLLLDLVHAAGEDEAELAKWQTKIQAEAARMQDYERYAFGQYLERTADHWQEERQRARLAAWRATVPQEPAPLPRCAKDQGR